MKKLIAVLIIGAVCIASAVWAIDVGEPVKPFIEVVLVEAEVTVDEQTGSTQTKNKRAKKVDEKTVEIITTVTVTQAVHSQTYDKAVLQTELDHINWDGIPEAQKRVDEILARKAELILILGVFEQ